MCAARRPCVEHHRCPADDLVLALRPLKGDDSRSQVWTFGRVLRILARLCEVAGAAALLPLVVHGNGMTMFRGVLQELVTLDDADYERWHTHLHLTQLLDELLGASVEHSGLTGVLQAKVREAA